MAFPVNVGLSSGQKTTVWAAAGKLSTFITAYFSALVVNINQGYVDIKEYIDSNISSVVGGLVYKGAFDASTAAFPVSAATGFFYKVSVAGIVEDMELAVGDHIVYNGTTWDKIDNTEITTQDASTFGTREEWGL